MRASILASFFLACCGPIAAQEQVKLRHQFKPGEKRDHVMEIRSTIKMNIAGMDIEHKVNQWMDITWEIKKVDDKGLATMEMRIRRAKMELDGIGDVDSDDPKAPDDPIARSFFEDVKAMAASRLTLTKNTRGEVSNIEVPEEVRKKLAAHADDDGNFNEGSLRAIAQSGIEFPETIALGKTWNQTQKFDFSIGKIEQLVKYTYRGQQLFNGREVHKFSYVQEMKVAPPKNDKNVLKSGRGRGTAYFDNQRGILLDESAEISMRMDTNIMGDTFTQEIVQIVTIRLKEEK